MTMTMTMTDYDYDYDIWQWPMTYNLWPILWPMTYLWHMTHDIWVHDNDSSIQELPECQSVDCCVRHTAEHQDAMPCRVHWPMKARALWLLHTGCRHQSNHVFVGMEARIHGLIFWSQLPAPKSHVSRFSCNTMSKKNCSKEVSNSSYTGNVLAALRLRLRPDQQRC